MKSNYFEQSFSKRLGFTSLKQDFFQKQYLPKMNAEFSALINELIRRNDIDGFKSWQELMALRVKMNNYVDSQTNEKQ